MIVRQLKQFARLRRTAMIVAAAFLWLCTAGTLRHSDDCASCAPTLASAPAAAVPASYHSGALPGPDNCAACQWLQVARDLPADHTISVATTAVAYEPFVGVIPTKPSLRTVRHASLRAPPLARA